MEDRSIDMDNMGSLRPQTFLFGCELKGNKEFNFKVDDFENEHQLSLRTVSLGAGAKDELHVVEAEALNYEGKCVSVTLASLKMSVQPTVSLGGFEITPPVKLRLKCGSGPVHISGQHLVALEEEESDEDYDEEDYDIKSPKKVNKRTANMAGSKVPQKKAKLSADDEEDEDEDEDDEDDDDEEEEEEEKTPKKPVQDNCGPRLQDSSAKNTPKSKQNGKDSKAAAKGKNPKLTPKTPPKPFTLEEIKAKMQVSVQKGASLPKLEVKFMNYVKNCFRTEDQKIMEALWQWRQTL